MKRILALICALALAKADPVRTKIQSYDEADPKQAQIICALENSDDALIAHEHCNQYYQCWDGKPIVRSCYRTLHYNTVSGVCDWPENVDCGTRTIPEKSEDHELDKTEEVKNICSSEGSEGLLVEHKSCNKFYKCHEGKPVSYKCPGHLRYNTILGYCDCANEVSCNDREVSDDEGSSEVDSNEGSGNCDPSEAPTICAAEGSDGVLIAHENCNQFYKCNHGVPVAFRCYGDLLFDPAQGRCEWSENVECGNRVIPTPNEEGNGDAGNGETEESENGNSGAGNCDPSQAENICANEGSDGTLVAHEICNKYYICSSGVPVVQKCPGNLLFDPSKDYCNWPEQVNCGERVIAEVESEENNGNEDSENENVDNGGSENGGGSTCHCNPAEAPELCAANESNGVLVAHENCNQFYTCVAGRPVAMSCSGVLLFNPYTEQCDWPDNMQCGDRVIPEEKEEDNSGGDNSSSGNGESDNGGSDNGSSDNGGSGTCNCNPAEAPELCAADSSDGVLVAHENCNQFYTCVAGRPVAMSCSGVLLFNPYTEQCDWPDNVQCGDRVIPEEKEEDNSGGDNGSSGNGESDNGSSNNGGSDNGGSDSGGSGTCHCNPAEAPELCAADSSDGVLVAHENCNQFYTCVAGRPVAMSCSGVLLFNPHTEQCDWPDNVQCGDRVIPEEKEEDNSGGDNGSSGNGESDNGSSDNGGSDNGGSDSGGSGTCHCNPAEAPELCAADSSDGVLVAHENCNQFYTCVAGRPVAMTCSGVLLFNPYTEQCDWPDNVQCGDRVIPEEKEEDNSGGDNGSSGNGESDNGSSDNGGSDNGGSDSGGSGTCHCNPAEAPELCAADSSDGVLVAHENCNQFYTCVAGRPVAMTCSGVLLFNPYTEQCDWPDNVQCGDRVIPEEKEEDSNGGDNGSSDNCVSGTCNCNPAEAPELCAVEGSDGVLVAHENCNQYYTCVAGRPVAMSCSGVLLFNPYTKQCDWPDNVQCGDRVLPEDCEDNNSGGSDNGGSDNGSSDNGGSDNGGSGVCNCNPAEAPAICAADGSDGVHVAHENCNQFYTCVSGHTVSQSCPGITLYNPYTQQCDWPDNVQCGERVIVEDCEEDNNGGSDNGETDNGGSGTSNCNPAEAPAICAADGSEGVHVAHENCNQFYTCVSGHPVSQRCPGTTLYNPYTQQCDWPDNVQCGERVIAEDCEEDNNGSNDNGGTDNGGSGTCNCNPAEAPAICAADGSGGVHVAHENCNQFYTCVLGHPVTQSCPGTTLYNPYTEQCDWPDNVVCGERVITNGEEENTGSNDNGNENDYGDSDNCNPANAPSICAADGSDGTLVAHENCNQFYTCAEGSPVTLTCPGVTLYNPLTTGCDWPDNVICGDRVISIDGENKENEDAGSDSENNGNDHNIADASVICGKSGSEGIFLAHEQCNQFVVCLEGRAVAMNCSGVLLYNPQSENCDWPENVDCGSRVIPSDIKEHGKNDDVHVIDIQGEDDVTEDAEDIETEYETALKSCGEAGSSGVQLPHEDCHRYYICMSSRPVVVTCTSNFLYDITTGRCNYPENVDCGRRTVRAV